MFQVVHGPFPHKLRHHCSANSFVDIPIVTGMGIGRNVIIARTADLALAIDGKYGTLSEIAYFLQLGKKVVGINTWNVSEDIIHCKIPAEALDQIDSLLK